MNIRTLELSPHHVLRYIEGREDLARLTVCKMFNRNLIDVNTAWSAIVTLSERILARREGGAA